MRVTVCGARGSTPASGPEIVRYGGHTSCVALAHDGERPSLVLDAGTGIRGVTALLGTHPFDGSIILGHLHWDHTQGLPFFAGADRPDARTDFYMPEPGRRRGGPAPRHVAAPFPHHPRPAARHLDLSRPRARRGPGHRGLHRRWPGRSPTRGAAPSASASPTRRPPWPISRTTVPPPSARGPTGWASTTTRPWPSPPTRTCSSTTPSTSTRSWPGAGQLRPFLGPATPSASAERAGAARLLLFHHDPPRTDDDIDAIVASYAAVHGGGGRSGRGHGRGPARPRGVLTRRGPAPGAVGAPHCPTVRVHGAFGSSWPRTTTSCARASAPWSRPSPTSRSWGAARTTTRSSPPSRSRTPTWW